MNKHLQKIIFYTRGIFTQLKQWFLELSRTKQSAVVAAVAIIVVIVVRALGGSSVAPETASSPRVVSLALVSSLSSSDSPIPLLGTVTSTSEATIRSEVGGKLTRVYKKLGDTVVAGQVIAEFENSGERAAVLQAEGAYDAAKAARDIAMLNSGQTSSSLIDAKTNALNAISSAYINMDDVIRVKTDGAFIDPRNTDAHFNISVPDMNLTYSLESRRKNIETMLIARDARNRTLTTDSNLVAELATVTAEVQTVKTYLDDLSVAYSKALVDSNYSQSSIDSGKAIVSVARGIISSTLSSVTSSKTSLGGSITAEAVAGKTSGGANVNTSVSSADASVKSALGTYDGAVSRLEKTIIRSPISGTLNSLSIQTGDFVPGFTEVAVVSNNGALEVVAYVTEDDAKRIQVGNEVSIDNQGKGVITRIASAIDPRTKKIEVRVGITDKTSTLVNGQSVRVNVTKGKQVATTRSGPITIPLSALKLTPNGAFVFTLSATSSLVAIPVTEGAILGENIQILSGLTGSESIVTDARGLKTDMVVSTKE
jgi:multidrug efflux pump subunit AcrA (membrane-fusion protein)